MMFHGGNRPNVELWKAFARLFGRSRWNFSYSPSPYFSPFLLSPLSAVPPEGRIIPGSQPSSRFQDFILSPKDFEIRQLPVNMIHRYNVFLQKNQFLHVMVDQDPSRERKSTLSCTSVIRRVIGFLQLTA